MNELFPWSPPAWVPIQAWEAFVSMRKSKGARNKWTPLARDRAIQKLDDMRQRQVDIAEVLLTCAEFGWVGVEWGEDEVAKRSARAVSLSRRDGAEPPSRQMRALQSLSGGKR